MNKFPVYNPRNEWGDRCCCYCGVPTPRVWGPCQDCLDEWEEESLLEWLAATEFARSTEDAILAELAFEQSVQYRLPEVYA